MEKKKKKSQDNNHIGFYSKLFSYFNLAREIFLIDLLFDGQVLLNLLFMVSMAKLAMEGEIVIYFSGCLYWNNLSEISRPIYCSILKWCLICHLSFLQPNQWLKVFYLNSIAWKWPNNLLFDIE